MVEKKHMVPRPEAAGEPCHHGKQQPQKAPVETFEWCNPGECIRVCWQGAKERTQNIVPRQPQGHIQRTNTRFAMYKNKDRDNRERERDQPKHNKDPGAFIRPPHPTVLSAREFVQ